MKINFDEPDLDPEDWEQFRKLGYEMIDLLVSYHKTLRERDVWKITPESVKENLNKPIPLEGSSLEEVFHEFQNLILPYPTGNIHPRFWGWVHGTGTSSGALYELLAATMNPNTGGREHVANYVERQVISWACEMLGYDEKASGLLTSGCSMANLTGLAVARQVKTGGNMRKDGLLTLNKQLIIYGSDQLHSSIQKAVEVLGLGSDSLRIISTNPEYEMNIDELRKSIESDVKAGLFPLAIVGNAGTVNTAAMDDFEAIAILCQEYDLWFHIDGAFGALARILPEYDKKMKGFELADSIGFDMHKWLYIPYEIGCILVKNERAHRETFSLRPDYLSQEERGLASFKKWPTEYGVELSRGFRSLKAWMLIKEHGLDKYRKVLKKNVEQARYLAHLIEESPNLELMAAVSLNIVCFRYRPKKLDLGQEELEQLNREILLQVQESGVAVFSSTHIKSGYALRVANTNQRSKFEDFNFLVETILEYGKTILKTIE